MPVIGRAAPLRDASASAPTSASARGRLARAGLRAKKSWGQHFLHDPDILAAIVAACAVAPGKPFIELGAGLGALTEPMLEAGAHVIAVERDRDLVPLLQAALGHHAGLTVHAADACGIDYAAWAERLGGPVHVVGNLPYQLSGRILVNLAAPLGEVVQAAVLMLQREVAERAMARPGGHGYGLLSVLLQRRFDVAWVCEVPPGCFFPPPKVSSAVIRLSRHGCTQACGSRSPLPGASPGSGDEGWAAEMDAALVQAARTAFASRRKTLRRALCCAPELSLRLDAASAQAILDAAGIDGDARAETLDVAAFGRLGASLRAWSAGLGGRGPV